MKTKIVLWGNDENDKRILIAIQLRSEDNKVDVYTFHDEQANENLQRILLYEWREGKETAFPTEGFVHHEMALSLAESILPETVKVENMDLINRAQSEWQFVVLSSKLYQSYRDELEDLESKIGALETYDSGLWENLKGFWDKVRGQLRERNLSRNHADTLKEKTNMLFAKMKELNSKLNEVFVKQSQEVYDRYDAQIADVNKRLKDGGNLQMIFEELKTIQQKFRNEKLVRDMRSKMWDKIDETFKVVKLQKFGPEAMASGNTPFQRLDRRFQGLLKALKKMEESINRDQEELNFQEKRIKSSDSGQLESQLREAKMKMVKDRIHSKSLKLKDMNETRDQLTAQMEKLRKKEEEKAAKQKEREERKTKKTPEAPAIAMLVEEEMNKSEAPPETKEDKVEEKGKDEGIMEDIKPVSEPASASGNKEKEEEE